MMKHLSGKCLALWAMLMLSGAGARAQSQPELSVPIIDLLQYQRAKQKRREPPVPFRRYQMKRIRASKVLSDDDPRRIWGYHVGANGEYDKAQQPLYRLFKRKGGSSLAIVDSPDGPEGTCQVVFWNKQYYLRWATELRRMGFTVAVSSRQNNILEFRKDGLTVGINVTIWPDIYLLEVLTL